MNAVSTNTAILHKAKARIAVFVAAIALLFTTAMFAPQTAYAAGEITADVELTAKFSGAGSVVVPQATLTNNTDKDITMTGARAPEGYNWTCDVAGKVVPAHGSITVEWICPDPLTEEQTQAAVDAGKLFIGNFVYTYKYEQDSAAYAIYSADDQSLTFVRSTTAPTEGVACNLIDDKIATAVYSGVETETYATAEDVPWAAVKPEITTVTIRDEVVPLSTKYWFCDMYNCTSMDLTKLNTLDIVDGNMDGMFSSCTSLSTLILSENFRFNSSAYTRCDLPAAYWKHSATSNIYNYMELMENYDGTTMAGTYLKEIPAYAAVYGGNTLVLGRGNTAPSSYNGLSLYESWTNIEFLLQSQIGRYDVPWQMGYASSITNVIVIDEIRPTWTAYWFSNMSNCSTIDISLMNTSSITANTANLPYMAYMQMENMFLDSSKLTSITFPENFGSGATNMGSMFQGCSSLTSLDLSRFDTSNVTNMENMFHSCSKLTSITFPENFGSGATNMGSMFQNCSSLTSLDLSRFDTSNVTYMNNMFRYCSRLTSLDLSSFDTSNVTNMASMFRSCLYLTSLDLSRFDTSNVTNMENMFDNAYRLVTIYASELWDTTSVTRSTDMFYSCEVLEGDIAYNSSIVDKTYAKTSEGYLTFKASPKYTVTFMANDSIFNTQELRKKEIIADPGTPTYSSSDDYVFAGWSPEFIAGITTVTGEMTFTAQWAEKKTYAIYSETDNSLTFIRSGFAPTEGVACNLINGKIATAVYSGVETETYATAEDVPWAAVKPEITTVDFKNETTPCSLENWFNGCTKLTDFNATNLNTSQVTSMSNTFANCSSLKNLSLGSFNTSNVQNFAQMFYNCQALESLDLSNWEVDAARDMTAMFCNASNITTLGDVSDWNTSLVASMCQTFKGCSALTELDLSGWDTSRVTDFEDMFSYNSALAKLDLSGFDTSNAASMDNMFGATAGTMHLLEEVVLGEGFKFAGNGTATCVLPTPDGSYVHGASGSWYDLTGAVYTPEELASIYDGTTMAGAYYAVNPGAAYAIYSADDQSLTFVRSTTAPTEGVACNLIDGKIATAVYTDFESTASVPWSENATNITTVIFVDTV